MMSTLGLLTDETGAHNSERATPILSLSHGVFTDDEKSKDYCKADTT